MSHFPQVSPKQSFPALESEVLAYWKANNTFQKSIDSRPEDNPYRFYDGPPFITGTPHYGSLLSSVVKDAVGRYWTMRGRRVDRIWGWDCHGLPIEEKVQKKLWLASNKEIEEHGIKEFIDGCYEYTQTTSAEWDWYIDKIGRWVDMDRAYRTMDQDYMESVMWVFKKLWDKGLVYKGKRVSLYSWKLCTPISNFEVAMDDTYQDVNDPAITVKFPLTQDQTCANEKECGQFEYTEDGYLRYVLGVVKNENGEILQLKNKKHGGKWQCPGGKIDKWETAETALKREIKEELGVECEIIAKLSDNKIFTNGTLWQGEYYEVELLGEPKIQEPHKHEKLEWTKILTNENGEKILKTETESYNDENFIRENYDISHLSRNENNSGKISILAWTTTPWTIPANMALAVGKDIDYVLVSQKNEKSKDEDISTYLSELKKYPPFTKAFFERNFQTVFNERKEHNEKIQFHFDEYLAQYDEEAQPFERQYSEKNYKIGGTFQKFMQYALVLVLEVAEHFPEWKKYPLSLTTEWNIGLFRGIDDFFDTIGENNFEKFCSYVKREIKQSIELFLAQKKISDSVEEYYLLKNPILKQLQLLANIAHSEQFIVAKSRAENVFKGKGEYQIIREFKGEELVWLGYQPPFDYYYNNQNNPKNHKVYHADFATDTDGTGIVHTAPEFGDVDYILGKEIGLTITEALDNEGKYTEQIHDATGLHYLDANKENTERMKANGTLFKNESITHRVPFCPRSGTPLVQKAQDSWFIDIQSQKEKLLQANEKINWFPTYLKHGRFAKGIESAPDWCISRTRFWGCPMPVWLSADGKEQIVVDSREEIFELNKPYGQLEKREVEGQTKYFFTGGQFAGQELNLHRPYIDEILIAPKTAQQSQKIIGIHGWKSSTNGHLWRHLKDSLGIEVPIIDQNEETNYAIWKAKFDTLNLANYDTIVAHSLGCPMIMQYLVENNISLDRLILVAPSNMIHNTSLEKIATEITADKKILKNLVKEIVIVHSKDDDSASAKYEYGKELAEELHAKLVTIDGCKHRMENGGAKIVEGVLTHGTPLVRIKEVLDVWMDSGSMPYAQMHYPFENKNSMEASFPADFIAEYVGQVRAWFYVMHVLGVLLGEDIKNTTEPTPSFTNVITTGVINGNDGRKMSKSYGNYPDPRATIEKYGADPIRFYMLNSPLLSGGDMDFKEEGIIETIKSVMLPIWNTYSFFTTYANIDGWKKNDTEVFFVRHAESETNVAGKVSEWNENPHITENGKLQAKNTGEILKNQGLQFDIIIRSNTIRTEETAKIIAEEIGFEGEIIVDDNLREQAYGQYKGKSFEEILAENHLEDTSENHIKLRKITKNNNEENVEQFNQRILSAYKNILEKYAGKRILIVGHHGTPQPIIAKYHGRDFEKAMFDTLIPNAEPFRLMTTPLANPLDQWILSKLQVLIGKVHEAMDVYDVSKATRAIVEYMNELTNWYVRLSRRRFWGSEMTADKNSAYETLHAVLVETSKLLAPYMPFMAEDMFRGLTGRESVHLEYVTLPNQKLISEELNHDMELASQFVSLGLSLRSRKNIRVRQPLASITITHELSDYYQEIIKNELNVKEVIFENPEKLAKKICKPDARKIGPKFGKDVQKIIVAAKNGDFTENADGSILVGEFRLEAGEFGVEYQPLEGVNDVEGGYGLVISMDTNLTDELMAEGFARDIIRQIQDMRKEADYQVTDKISLSLSSDNLSQIVNFISTIETETLSTFVENLTNADITKEIELENFGKILITLKK